MTYKRHSFTGLKLAIGSVVLVVVLLLVLQANRANHGPQTDELLVYCASGIRLPVEAAAKQFEAEMGVKIRLEYDSSGGLEGKLKLDKDNGRSRADIYIPADASFAERAKGLGLTEEIIPLSQFHLVLGLNPDFEGEISSVQDVLDQDVKYALCEPIAGVGKRMKAVLEPLGRYQAIYDQKKVGFTRVTETANAAASTGELDGAFVWNTTAKQFGLEVVELPEFAEAYSEIVGAVVAGSESPADALRFIRYLASPEKGAPLFAQFHFDPLKEPGDHWAPVPELVVYCGGVNQHAVKQTLDEFERREGCDIVEQFAGCGKLIANIQAIEDGAKGFPDAFMTCDASYMTKVEEGFDTAEDVSSTRIIMLVRKGNPKQIRSIEDLKQPGLAVGVTDARVSTLGNLSQQIFAAKGALKAIEANKNIAVTTPTAHELILQMLGHTKLDVALVYEANCNEIKDDFELITIDHPLARTVQNVAVSRKSPYPAMSNRLMQALLSAESRKRFESSGFIWKGNR